MNMLTFKKCLFALLLFSHSSLIAQPTQTVDYIVPFASGNQNMWGPSWDAVNLNISVPLFDVSWDESFGFSAITNIIGFDFGFGVNGSFSGTIGAEFNISNFSTGEVAVNYPIDVTLTMNEDLSYDPGDQVRIETEYALEPGTELNTMYPNAGEATLDLYFQMGASLSATLCAFGCTTFPIIPSFNTGMQNINVFTINESEITFFSVNGGAPAYAYSVFPLNTSTIVPNADPLGEIGLTGILDMPHVYTLDGNSGVDLYACGGGEHPDSAYIQVDLNIFDLLSNIPGPQGEILANLDGDEDIPIVSGASLSWTFFGAILNLDFHNKQCFDFNPKVYGRFEFPVAVDYSAYGPTGTLTSSGTSSIINVQIGGYIDYKYPCYFTELNIEPTYSIDGQFRNHTYDSVALYLYMSALSFGLVIPSVEITPEITIPEICIPIPYPCPSWSCPWCWCTYTACTPSFTIPALNSPAIDWDLTDIGLNDPVWEYTLDLTNFQYDWYDNTWALEGFDQHIMADFTMYAQPRTITTTQTNVNCYGQSTGSIDVTINATAYDISTPYTYSWTNGQTTEDISSLPAGAYELISYDTHGCELFTGTTILQPSQELAVGVVAVDKSCNGGPNDGSANITVIGGTSPYTYSWTNGATTEDISGLAPGVYTVTVTDFRGCTKVASATIGQPAVLGQAAAISNVSCNGGVDGAISVDVFGGTLPYTFSWSSGQTTEDLTSIPGGSFTLTVTDGKFCTSIAPYIVSQPIAPLALVISGVNVLCKGGSTGAINLTTSGGTPGYSYQWSSSLGVLLPFITEDLSNVSAGTYFVTATDSKGCIALANQLISEPIQGIASNPTLVHINCFGQSTGSITSGISGGTPGYNYNWSNGATSTNLMNVAAGTYTLTVTDFNLCVGNFTYLLTQPVSGLNLTLAGVNVKCFGESTGSVTSTITGGTQPYSYSWSNGALSANISTVPAATYTLTITDNVGCTVNTSQIISQPLAPLALTSVITDVDCYGNNSGSVDLSVSGGTAPYTYQWSNNASIILNTFAQDISTQYADSYNALVTDANLCQANLISIVTQPVAPLNFTGIVNDVNCFGGNDGAIDITVTGGTTNYSYSWSNGAVTEDLSAIISGSYTLTITDFNGCTSMSSFSVIQPNSALTATLVTEDVLCNGDATGSIESFVTGGTTPYTYLWSNGATTDEIISVQANPYSLTVTDAQGCTSFTGALVNEPSALILTPTVTDALCFGNSDGQIVISVVGGEQPYYFSWGNQNEILLNNASETLSGLIAEDYFIRVRDKNNCIIEQYITVGQPALQEASFTTTNVLCFEDSTGIVDVTFTGGTMPFTNVWNDGQTTEDAIGLGAGIYTFMGTDAQGCKVGDTAIIYQPDLIEITYEITTVSCVDQSDAVIFVNAYGGTPSYSFNWSSGQTTQNVEDLLAGTYILIITDNNTCSQSFNFEILTNDVECLDIPNTITPNGDNYNDTWILENIDLYTNAVVKIFNKWGNEIFSSTSTYIPWDGTDNGNPLPSEVYYYIINLNNPEDNQYTGTITIIR